MSFNLNFLSPEGKKKQPEMRVFFKVWLLPVQLKKILISAFCHSGFLWYGNLVIRLVSQNIYCKKKNTKKQGRNTFKSQMHAQDWIFLNVLRCKVWIWMIQLLLVVLLSVAYYLHIWKLLWLSSQIEFTEDNKAKWILNIKCYISVK